MKFSISWLKEHLDTTASVDEIAETLTKIGLEVEEVFNPASWLDGFVTAEVETYERHPDSDHLGLLTVNTGKEKLQVVCGAPNCRQGLKGIFAPVGVVIPCYNEELKVGKIRGVESFGMMCSEKELGVGEDHNGIIELPANTPIGRPAAEALDIDPVIEINITPNRAECLGVRGVARDLAAAGLGTLKPLKILKTAGTFKSPVNVKVVDEISGTNRVAEWNKQDNILYVKRGGETQDIFRELSGELARATLEETGNASLDNFKCRCTSYMLCKKYGIDVSSFNLDSIPDSLKSMSSNEIRNELGTMRNAMEDINLRMGQHFENISKKAKSKDLER